MSGDVQPKDGIPPSTPSPHPTPKGDATPPASSQEAAATHARRLDFDSKTPLDPAALDRQIVTATKLLNGHKFVAIDRDSTNPFLDTETNARNLRAFIIHANNTVSVFQQLNFLPPNLPAIRADGIANATLYHVLYNATSGLSGLTQGAANRIVTDHQTKRDGAGALHPAEYPSPFPCSTYFRCGFY